MEEQQYNEEQIQELENNCAEYLAGWQRSRADYENLRKDLGRQIAAAGEAGQMAVILQLLTLYDHFRMAVSHIPEEQKKQDWVQGILHISKGFQDFLKEAEVEEINSLGEMFDPNQHEAISEQESNQQEGTIIQQVQSGYQAKGRVIRPAKVIVAKSFNKK